MQENKLTLLNDRNEEITINASDIKGFQKYFGLETIDLKNYSMAGQGYEYIEITMKAGTKYNIIRNCKNDQQILDVILK